MYMEHHKDYEGFTYSGWQSAFDRTNHKAGFHLYTCDRCWTTIAETSIHTHDLEACDSVLNAKGRDDLENLLRG